MEKGHLEAGSRMRAERKKKVLTSAHTPLGFFAGTRAHRSVVGAGVRAIGNAPWHLLSM